MQAKLVNATGVVAIDEEVVAKVAGMTAMECYGIVGMAALNVKDGGLAQLLTGEKLTKGIKVTVNGADVVIDFHVIVEYGTNISAVAENLISTTKYTVQDMLGLTVADVKVFVEGIRTDSREE